MNKHVVRLLLSLSAAAPVISAHDFRIFAEAVQESEDGRETPTPVLSGAFYDAVRAIDARLEITEDSKGVFVMLDTGDEIPNPLTIRDYFRSMARILNTDAAKEYDSISFSLIGKLTFEMMSVSRFNGIHDFTASSFGSFSKDEEAGDAFTGWYWLTFGGHDTHTQSELDYIKLGLDGEVPANAQNGYIWAAASFPGGTDYKIDGTTISVDSFADNSYEGGKEAYTMVSGALNSYTDYITEEPLLMPYTEVDITIHDRIDYSFVLWHLTVKYQNGSWETVKNTATGDFLSGLVDG